MTRIVIMVYHGMGHFNACFRVGRILQKEHEIHFAGVEFFKTYVTAQRFSYYTLKSVPFGMGFENWVNTVENKRNIFFRSLQDRYNDSLYLRRERELHEMVEQLKPDILLIDTFQATDFIVLYPLLKRTGIACGLINITLPDILQWNCPPIDSMLLPGRKILVNVAVLLTKLKKKINTVFSRIKYAGMNNERMIRRRWRLNGVPEIYRGKPAALRGIMLQKIDELILSPREFDFSENVVTPNHHYVGAMIDEDRIDICDEKYLNTIAHFREQLSQKKQVLIYCSFGTVMPQQERLMEKFISRLVNVAVKNNYILIVSSGGKNYEHDDLPDIHFFKSVPQLEVLSVADVFITHGGFNSVKESIHAEVPMLVYLADSYGDQKGNSARIVYHQIGLRGSLKRDDEQAISEKISELLNNPVYRQNIKSLKKADAAYKEENLRKHITSLKPVT